MLLLLCKYPCRNSMCFPICVLSPVAFQVHTKKAKEKTKTGNERIETIEYLVLWFEKNPHSMIDKRDPGKDEGIWLLVFRSIRCTSNEIQREKCAFCATNWFEEWIQLVLSSNWNNLRSILFASIYCISFHNVSNGCVGIDKTEFRNFIGRICSVCSRFADKWRQRKTVS